MNYNYFLPCFVSAAAILAAGGALAQQCVQAPSCAELGYTKSASECSGKTALYCPFDKTKAYCADDVDCGEKAIVGEIRLWPSATPPAGWKICDGSALDKNTYSALYNVIGTTYGGSGNNFYLPNFKGRVPVGVGQVYGGSTYTYTLAETGGENFVLLSSDQIPDHKHIIPWGESKTELKYYPWGTWGSSKTGSGKSDENNKWFFSSYMYSRSGYRIPPTKKGEYWTSSGSCSAGQTYSCSTSRHENRMPFLVINYIIYVGDAGTSGSGSGSSTTDCSMYTQTPWTVYNENAPTRCQAMGRIPSQRKVTCNNLEYCRCALKSCGTFTDASKAGQAAATCCSGLNGNVDIVASGGNYYVYCT